MPDPLDYMGFTRFQPLSGHLHDSGIQKDFDMDLQLEGILTALVTPFDNQNQVDEDAFRKLVQNQIKNGVHGLVPCGTTGEAPTLSLEEKSILVKICLEEAKGKIPVIPGSGSNDTRQACNLQAFFSEMGADATLQVTPYYNRPTQEGLFQHFSAISKASHTPIVLYNVPSRTGVNLEVDTIVRLIKACPTIIAIKDANTDENRLRDLIARTTDERADFKILGGEDSNLLPLLILGGHGLVSVFSNAWPNEARTLWDVFQRGEIDYVRKIDEKFQGLHKSLGFSTNPIPIKTALGFKSHILDNFRLPLVGLDVASSDTLKADLDAQGWLA